MEQRFERREFDLIGDKKDLAQIGILEGIKARGYIYFYRTWLGARKEASVPYRVMRSFAAPD